MVALGCVIGWLPSLLADARADPRPTRIRFSNERIAKVFQYARERSPSFGELVATVELSDRIVYIEEGQCRHQGQLGCVLLMSTPGAKNLLIRLDPRQHMRLVAIQLAHELYHAAEIGRAPDVVDVASLRNLYERIGERNCVNPDDCWDTRAARTFGTLVAKELAGRPAKAPTPY